MRIFTEDTFFDLEEGETLLDALERTGHFVEYQCRSGYCGSCRIKLLVGSVDYPKPPLALIKRDEILPCCCRVKEDLKVRVRLKSNMASED
ncbi:class I ribonucleotide reductase maintenance protein YfaE [Pseudomonas sp. F1_0610]|uniref:class I ribonucleotide reductase maintenance protein YfaE n=1 Tax=Pseudomonas sp. F1_0610 TaxID=3114284 RepID=UPI0039C1990E